MIPRTAIDAFLSSKFFSFYQQCQPVTGPVAALPDDKTVGSTGTVSPILVGCARTRYAPPSCRRSIGPPVRISFTLRKKNVQQFINY